MSIKWLCSGCGKYVEPKDIYALSNLLAHEVQTKNGFGNCAPIHQVKKADPNEKDHQ